MVTIPTPSNPQEPQEPQDCKYLLVKLKSGVQLAESKSTQN